MHLCEDLVVAQISLLDVLLLLQNVPSKLKRCWCNYLTGDETAQPEVCPATNQKAFKLKERNDRLINTYETDPFFAAFTALLNKPVEKLSLADPVADSKKAASAQEDLIKNNPLLKYMREKAEKKVRDRRLAKKGLSGSAKESVVTSLLSRKSAGGGGTSKAAKEGNREGKEKKEIKEKSSRRSGEKKEKERGGRGGKRESADGEVRASQSHSPTLHFCSCCQSSSRDSGGRGVIE
jgi:hypothetical protein